MMRVRQCAFVLCMAVAGLAFGDVNPIALPPGMVSAESPTLLVADLRKATVEDSVNAGKAMDTLTQNEKKHAEEYFRVLGADRDKLVAAGVEILLTNAVRPEEFGAAVPLGELPSSAKTLAMVRLKAGSDEKNAAKAINAARETLHAFEVRMAEEAAKAPGATTKPALPKKPEPVTLVPVKDAAGWRVLQGEGFTEPFAKSDANDAARDRLEIALRPFSDAPAVLLFNMTDKLREELKNAKPKGPAAMLAEAAQQMECIAMAVYMGKNPRVALHLHLANAEAAEAMQDGLNRMLMVPTVMFMFAKPADKEDPLHGQITRFDTLMKGVLLKRQGRIVTGGCDMEQITNIKAAFTEVSEALDKRQEAPKEP